LICVRKLGIDRVVRNIVEKGEPSQGWSSGFNFLFLTADTRTERHIRGLQGVITLTFIFEPVEYILIDFGVYKIILVIIL